MFGTRVIFFPNSSDLQLVKSLDARPTDTERLRFTQLCFLKYRREVGEEGGSGRRGRGGGERGGKKQYGKRASTGRGLEE